TSAARCWCCAPSPTRTSSGRRGRSGSSTARPSDGRPRLLVPHRARLAGRRRRRERRRPRRGGARRLERRHLRRPVGRERDLRATPLRAGGSGRRDRRRHREARPRPAGGRTARRVRGAGGPGADRARRGVAARPPRATGDPDGRPPRSGRHRAPRARVARPRGQALTGALEQAAAVRRGDVSPAELVDDAIARIEATNPELNFLVTECFEQARATTPADGPFRGVPMLVKDLTETAGVRTTFSSRAFADYVPEHDAAVVRRMKDAGFVVLGKSNTPEFGITCVTESELN